MTGQKKAFPKILGSTCTLSNYAWPFHLTQEFAFLCSVQICAFFD